MRTSFSCNLSVPVPFSDLGDGRDMKRDEGARDDKLKQKSKERFTGSPSSGGRLSSVSGLPPLSKGDAEKGRTPENKKPEKSIWDTTSVSLWIFILVCNTHVQVLQCQISAVTNFIMPDFRIYSARF